MHGQCCLRHKILAGPIHPYADIVHRQRDGEEEEGSDEFVDAEESFHDDEADGTSGGHSNPSGQNNGGAPNPSQADRIAKQKIKQPNRGSSTTW